jgi:hypothetical protein
MAEQALKALNAELEGRIAERTVELERKLGELSQGFVGADAEGCIVEWNAPRGRHAALPRDR